MIYGWMDGAIGVLDAGVSEKFELKTVLVCIGLKF